MIIKDERVGKTIETYEDLAEDYSKNHFDIEEVRKFIDFFIQNLKGKNILDVGCGPGRDAKYFCEHGFDVTGIDLALNFVEMASRNVPGAKFLQMDMADLDFDDDEFDGVWACASFLHIPKKQAKDVLSGFFRVLKPGGLLFLSVKQGDGEKLVLEDIYNGRERFFALFSQDELKNLIESCGFDIIKIILDSNERSSWINVFAVKR